MTLIKYVDSTHEYSKDGVKYDSVTSVLKGLSNTDFNIPAYYTAKAKGITVEEVRAIWNRKAQAGTLLHELFERAECLPVLRGSQDELFSTPLDNLLGVYSEFIIHNDEAKLAGQIDRLEVFADRTFRIRDYKTDRYISFDGSYMSGRGEIIKKNTYFNFPCAHLHDCNGNKHTLQLSIYAYMLELHGYTLQENGLELLACELKMDGDEVVYNGKYPVIVGEPKSIFIPYLKDEAKNLLKYKNIIQ